jgi:hypothetical protein
MQLTCSQNIASELLAMGYRSAHEIAHESEQVFIAKMGQRMGGQTDKARGIYRKAVGLKNQIVHLWANLAATRLGAAFTRTRGSSLSEDTLEVILALPSYQDMFGNQNFCTCESCKSILGPAAYFVDIMRITDRYVSSVNAATIPSTYQLGQRRADLFTLELSCSTTNDTLPYLTIVNEILSRHVETEAKQEDVEWLLATSKYPFVTPNNLRLSRIRQTLASLDLSLTDFYGSTTGFSVENPQVLAQEALGLSLEQAAFVCTALADEESLKSAWGLRVADSLKSLSELSVFSRQSALSRQEISDLTRQGLSQAEIDAGLAHGFLFNLSLPAGQSVQIQLGDTQPDTLTNLTDKTLDALNRFIRLSRWSALPFRDTGTALAGLAITSIDSSALKVFASAQSVVKALDWSWSKATSLWADMPTTGRGEQNEAQDMFDQVWNNPAIRGDGAVYRPSYDANPLFKDNVVTWDVAAATTSDSNFGVSRLRAGLGLDADTLVTLAELAFPVLNDIPLTVPNLSRIFRLTAMTRATSMNFKQLGHVAAWLKINLTQYLSPESVALLLVFKPWMQGCGLSVAQIRFYLGEINKPDAVKAASVSYHDMLALWGQALTTLFTPAQLIGDTIDLKRATAIFKAILALKPAVALNVTTAYKTVIPNVPQQPIALVPCTVDEVVLEPLANKPLSLSKKEINQVSIILNSAHTAQAQVLNSGLAGPLSTQDDVVAALATLIAPQSGAQTWIGALLTPCKNSSSNWADTSAVLLQLSRLFMASEAIGLSPAVLDAMSTQLATFGLTESTLFSLESLKAFRLYITVRDALGLADEDFLAYLALPPDTECTEGQKAAALSLLTGWSQADICGVLLALNAKPGLYDSTAGLSRISKVFFLLRRGGFDAKAYKTLLDSRNWSLWGIEGKKHWVEFGDLADSIEGAVAAFLGITTWNAVRSTIGSALREAQRSSLVPMLLWYFALSKPEIKTASDLSGYLLIDVQMGGCFQTSRVVEATGAVQMYLNRVRANIEPGIDQLPIPQAWWEWMTTYRLWEANRRVFLYPENYLDPTLRSSRTVLFRK